MGVKQRGEQSAGEAGLHVFPQLQVCTFSSAALPLAESRVSLCCRLMLAALGGFGEQPQAPLLLPPWINTRWRNLLLQWGVGGWRWPDCPLPALVVLPNQRTFPPKQHQAEAIILLLCSFVWGAGLRPLPISVSLCTS